VNPVFGDRPQELFMIDFQKESDGSVLKAKARNGPEELEGEKVSDTPR
jgi:hypothetical protein